MTDPPPTGEAKDAGFDFGEVLSDLQTFRDDLRADRDVALDVYRSRAQPVGGGETGAARVRAVRGMLKLDPAPFAAFLGVTPRTVLAWERGTARPGPVARRFLEEIAVEPEHFRERAARA